LEVGILKGLVWEMGQATGQVHLVGYLMKGQVQLGKVSAEDN
jgi:hypothetical protein